MKFLTSAILALALASCGGDPLDGTWNLSGNLSALGTQIPYTGTATFKNSTKAFTIDLNTTGALTATIEAIGTYSDTSTTLTLNPSAINPTGTTEGTSSTDTDGSACLALKAAGGAKVCFPKTQTNPFTIVSGTLTTSVTFTSAGTASALTLSGTKAK